MNFTPLYDRVVILPKNNERTTEHGIVLPNTSQERPQFGTVVAVGDGENPDREGSTMKLKVGDKVLLNKYAGVELTIEGTLYIVMRQIDVIGVMND